MPASAVDVPDRGALPSATAPTPTVNDSGGSEEGRSAQRISDSGDHDGTDNSGATRSCENGCQVRLEPAINEAQPEGKTRGETADARA